jgi:hypothetical protein
VLTFRLPCIPSVISLVILLELQMKKRTGIACPLISLPLIPRHHEDCPEPFWFGR